MVEERRITDRVWDVVIMVFLAALGISCLLPLVNQVAKSLSSSGAVISNQVSFWPVGFTVDNYGWLMTNQQFLRSFGVSIARVAVGVPLTLLFTVITAYPLSQDRLRIPGRSLFKLALLFGMLFSGGIIPLFLSYKKLGLLNTFAVLVVPGALNIFLTILVANFFRGIPEELSESAVMDGASHFAVLFRIFLPLSLPSLATVSLFSAVGHWNSWFDGIVFISKSEKWPLQSFLYMQVTLRSLQQTAETGRSHGGSFLFFNQVTPEALQAAMIVLATVPIIMVYPFLQRYFVHGLTLGAVKG